MSLDHSAHLVNCETWQRQVAILKVKDAYQGKWFTPGPLVKQGCKSIWRPSLDERSLAFLYIKTDRPKDRVAKLVDALYLECSEETRVGSTPISVTRSQQ